MNQLKRYYINVKFDKYGTYTFEAKSKEHAIELYKNGDYDFSDYTEDFGEFNEVIEDIEAVSYTHLTLPTILLV